MSEWIAFAQPVPAGPGGMLGGAGSNPGADFGQTTPRDRGRRARVLAVARRHEATVRIRPPDTLTSICTEHTYSRIEHRPLLNDRTQ